MARIPPLPPGEWPPAMQDALAALRPENPRHPFPSRAEGRPKGLNLLGTLARHPELTRAYHTYVGHVLFASTLAPPPDRPFPTELLAGPVRIPKQIIRIGRNWLPSSRVLQSTGWKGVQFPSNFKWGVSENPTHAG